MIISRDYRIQLISHKLYSNSTNEIWGTAEHIDSKGKCNDIIYSVHVKPVKNKFARIWLNRWRTSQWTLFTLQNPHWVEVSIQSDTPMFPKIRKRNESAWTEKIKSTIVFGQRTPKNERKNPRHFLSVPFSNNVTIFVIYVTFQAFTRCALGLALSIAPARVQTHAQLSLAQRKQKRFMPL